MKSMGVNIDLFRIPFYKQCPLRDQVCDVYLMFKKLKLQKFWILKYSYLTKYFKWN